MLLEIIPFELYVVLTDWTKFVNIVFNLVFIAFWTTLLGAFGVLMVIISKVFRWTK